MFLLKKFKDSQFTRRQLTFLAAGTGLTALGGLLYLGRIYLKKRRTNQSLDSFEYLQSYIGKKMDCGKWFNEKDQASLSNFEDALIIETKLTLDISFQTQIISGKADLKFKAINDIKFLELDCKFLKIKSVSFANQNLSFDVKQYAFHSAVLGDQLLIKLPRQMNKNDIFSLTVIYETMAGNQADTSGLSWLEPAQTFGLKYPFLYTQSEPIYARSLFPCQDTPSVKAIYEILLIVDAPLSAYASGIQTDKWEENGRKHFFYKQPIPIPAYLLAIVAGELDFQKLSNRIGIITEPVFMEKCKKEFSEMDNYLTTIETYITPFEWKEFNLVVLPKSFPFGGMENPNLTFVSPSIVIGDKSCTDVVIHEMVHSWSGNLITCQNWECFWLNEGLTMFLEREATRILHGQDIYELDAVIGDRSLKQAIESYGVDHTYTSLTPGLKHENPDDAFSTVPYEKGFQFLRYLQTKIGNVKFREFILQLINKYKGITFNAENFKADLEGFIAKENVAEFEINWKAWVLDPGFPPMELEFEEKVVAKYQKFVELLISNPEEFKEEENINKFNELTSMEKTYIFDQMINQEDKLTKNDIEVLDKCFDILREWKNPELLYRFYLLAIKKDYSTALNNHLSEFLQQIGRMKFLKPIYQALTVNHLQLAEQTFKLASKSYHSIASEQIRKVIQKAQK